MRYEVKSIYQTGKFAALTEFHADVFIWVFLPELLVLIFVTHEREDDLLTYGL